MTDVLGTPTQSYEFERATNGRSFFNIEHDKENVEALLLTTQITEKLEADASLNGFFAFGDRIYAVFKDPGRTTVTQNALFGVSDEKWIAYSGPSSPQLWDSATMRIATPDDNLQLINDAIKESQK